MTDCPDAERRDLLPDLVHGRLTPGRRADLELHLAACADCRAELEILRRVHTMLLHAAPVRAEAAVVAAIVGALPAYRGSGGGRSWRVAAAAAAVAAIILGGSSLIVARRAPAGAPGVAVVPAIALPTSGSAPVRIASAGPLESLPARGGAQLSVRPRGVGMAAATRSLPVEGAVGELSDRELRQLLAGLRSLKALPAAAGETDETSLAPASGRGAL